MSSPERFSTGGRRRWQPPALEQLQALLPAYHFEALLGCGGMGAVFKATQRSLQRAVAIKVLPREMVNDGEDSEFAARFRQEALTLAKLTHPGIVNIIEAGEAGGLLYLVMEFVDGSDLAHRLRLEGRLSTDQVLQVLVPVCDALEYAHRQGILHRDLKPANLLLTREGIVKIADFGIAKSLDDESLGGLTQTNVSVGSPDFLAPEAWTPGVPLDARADVYALGVTLYQMLTGEVPRGFWEMPSVRVGADPRFDAIIERAMQPTPEARYASAAEMRVELDRLRTGGGDAPLAARPELSAEPTDGPATGVAAVRWSKGFRLGVGVVALVVFAGVLALTLPRWRSGGDGPRSAATPAVRREPEPTSSVREAARWLLRENAKFRILHDGREIEVQTEEDLPVGEIQIVYLWFDRWASSPPQPPPPDKEFEVLRAVKTLRYAFMRLPGLSDAAFAFLAGNPELQTLHIVCPDRLTDGVFVHLTGLAKLETLAISHSPRITGWGIAGSAWLASLKEVDFLYASLGAPSLRVLAGSPRLEQVKLEGTPITHDDLQILVAMPGLRGLDVGGCANLREEDYAQLLPRFLGLRKLRVDYAAFGDAALNAVAALTNLVELGLTGTQVTDAGLAALAPLTRLESVTLGHTAVTAEGFAALERVHPRCRVDR
jgi:hypothetical protein